MGRWIISLVVVSSLIAGMATANLRRSPGSIDLDWGLFREPPPAVALSVTRRAGRSCARSRCPGSSSRSARRPSPRVAGRAVAVEVAEDDHVAEGDVLVRLDDPAARVHTRAAEQRLEELCPALAEAEQSWAECDRAQAEQYRAQGYASPTPPADASQRLARAQAAVADSRRAMEAAEAARDEARRAVEDTVTRAPMAGVVDGITVAPGDQLLLGPRLPTGPGLMSVFDASHLWVRATVDEADAPLVRAGEPARVFLLQSDPKTPLAGRVEHVAPRGQTAGIGVSFPALGTGVAFGLRPAVKAALLNPIDALEARVARPGSEGIHAPRRKKPG